MYETHTVHNLFGGRRFVFTLLEHDSIHIRTQQFNVLLAHHRMSNPVAVCLK